MEITVESTKTLEDYLYCSKLDTAQPRLVLHVKHTSNYLVKKWSTCTEVTCSYVMYLLEKLSRPRNGLLNVLTCFLFLVVEGPAQGAVW